MQARFALPVIVAAILFMRAPCVSAGSSAPALDPGVVIVPAAWAGVWDVTEETTSGSSTSPSGGACGTGSVTRRSYR